MGNPLIARLVKTKIGHRILASAATADPQTALAAVGFHLERAASFRTVDWPKTLDGFEDCAFVLSSNDASHGVAQLSIAEAAHLYRLVSRTPGPHVEIGRYKGGGTFVMAAALQPGHTLVSVDNHEKAGPEPDADVLAALQRFELAARVRLLVGDSHTIEVPDGPFGVVFLDGDPSTEGTRVDIVRWGGRLRSGGHLVLHDATPGAGRHEAIGGLVSALNHDDNWLRQPNVGTMAHFRRA